MSNPIRVATAALSGQIFAGRPTKDGLGFKEPRYDVTSDVLKAVVDKIGIGFQTDIASGDEIICTIKIVGPDHPAAPSADRLREAMKTACDLLAERTYGHAARSPGHNARIVLEHALATPDALKGGAK